MKHKSSLILFLLVASITSVYSQEIKEDAHTQIKMLKKGALFVRLKTSDLAIAGLKKQGKEKEAEEIRAKQETENKAIVAAFKTEFTFCTVYFFYSNNSDAIKAGTCKDLLFDTNFQNVSAPDCNNFLIGEFDESETTHISAFIIKDKNYNQLKPPFPFLIKTNARIVATRTKEDTVMELNRRLNEFWAKNQ